MLNQVLVTLLPLLLWGGITGIINLAFGYKSQIEAWAESRPRVAALLKLSRAVGLDPWNILSAIKLAATKKLPDAQKSDSPSAKLEQRKADARRLDDTACIGPLLVLLFLAFAIHQQGCASAQPPCDESKLRAADRDYVAAVSAACLPDYPDKESCPAWPALRDKHRADLKAVCP